MLRCVRRALAALPRGLGGGPVPAREPRAVPVGHAPGGPACPGRGTPSSRDRSGVAGRGLDRPQARTVHLGHAGRELLRARAVGSRPWVERRVGPGLRGPDQAAGAGRARDRGRPASKAGAAGDTHPARGGRAHPTAVRRRLRRGAMGRGAADAPAQSQGRVRRANPLSPVQSAGRVGSRRRPERSDGSAPGRRRADGGARAAARGQGSTTCVARADHPAERGVLAPVQPADGEQHLRAAGAARGRGPRSGAHERRPRALRRGMGDHPRARVQPSDRRDLARSGSGGDTTTDHPGRGRARYPAAAAPALSRVPGSDRARAPGPRACGPRSSAGASRSRSRGARTSPGPARGRARRDRSPPRSRRGSRRG